MKTVKAKVHNKEFTDLTYNPVTDKWEALLQVPDEPSVNPDFPVPDLPSNRYGITVDMVDEAGNMLTLDRNSPTWGWELTVAVDENPDPSRIRLMYPTPPEYRVRSVHGEEGTGFMEFRVYCSNRIDETDVQILFDGQDINELNCYYQTDVITGTDRYIRFSYFMFDPEVDIIEGTHQITIIAGYIPSLGDSRGGLTIFSFPLLYDTDPCEFIFDRTQADVDYVKQLKEKYLNGTIADSEKSTFNGTSLKGARNRSDFIRILTNMIYIAGKFGIPFSMTVEGLPELPKESYVQQLRDEVQRFRTSLAIHNDTPLTPILPINTYQKMNDLEKILFDIHDALKFMEQLYVGDDFYIDEQIGVL